MTGTHDYSVYGSEDAIRKFTGEDIDKASYPTDEKEKYYVAEDKFYSGTQ